VTVTGIITALIVGLAVGALGRLAVPGRQHIPIWLTMAVGVVAALLGTVLVRLAGVNTSGFSPLELLLQVVLATVGVVLAAVTSRRHRDARVR
jgi:uncharacterized membrane protein YeaQ/YmgE (transglycosylase-associated protein family)